MVDEIVCKYLDSSSQVANTAVCVLVIPSDYATLLSSS